jgi:hypothetical protein
MRSRLRSVHRRAKAVVFRTKRFDCAGVTGIANETQLSFPGLYGSSVSIGSNSRIGRIEYSYEPQLVVHP